MQTAMMTPREVADLIGCSAHHVTDMLAGGELPGIKLGRRWYVNRKRLYVMLGIEEGECSQGDTTTARSSA